MPTTSQIDPSLFDLVIDRTKSAKENFLVLINSRSTHQYTTDELEIGLASAFAPDDSNEYTNTCVTIAGAADSGFKGHKTIRYRRLALGSTRLNADVVFTAQTGEDFQTVFNRVLNEHNLVEEEVTLEGDFPSNGQSAIWKLVANEGSLLYIGQMYVQINSTVVS